MTPAELVAAAASGTRLMLREDVKNPYPDRRVTRDWRKESIIAKGTKFYVQRDHDTKALCLYVAGDYSFKCLYFRPDGSNMTRHHGVKAEDFDLDAAMLPLLEADKRVLGSVAAKHHQEASGAAVIVVGELLKAGRLTYDEIDAILTADRAAEDA